MLISKIFNTSSDIFAVAVVNIVTLLSRNIAFFFAPKAFCDTQKVLKRRLWPGLRPRPGWGGHDAPQTR